MSNRQRCPSVQLMFLFLFSRIQWYHCILYSPLVDRGTFAPTIAQLWIAYTVDLPTNITKLVSWQNPEEFLCTSEQFLVHSSFENPGSDFVLLSAVRNRRDIITTHLPRLHFSLKHYFARIHSHLLSTVQFLIIYGGDIREGLGTRLAKIHSMHIVWCSTTL